MLCATCISMFQGPKRNGTHHHSFGNLLQAADSGCKICIYLRRLRELGGADESGESTQPFTNFRFQAWDNGEDGVSITIEIRSVASWLTEPMNGNICLSVSNPQPTPWWWTELLGQVEFDLSTEPWRVRDDQFESDVCAKNTGDIEVANICSEWFNKCIKHHETCEDVHKMRQPDYYPDRLLDLGTLEYPSVRLISSHNLARGHRYATLSHCWGSNTPFIKLTADNMSLLCDRIAINDLPKTFSDAILTCQRLRIRYLWIDSLCILQSGPEAEEDWHAHVASMHIIYANCILNLAAAGASNPEKGLFVDRDSNFIRTTFVLAPEHMNLHKAEDYLDRDGNSEKSEVDTDGAMKLNAAAVVHDTIDEAKNSSGDSKKVCLVTIFAEYYDFFSYLTRQPLWKRAWVFQERLMSPRTLLFGQDRVYWQCNEKLLNEYLRTGLPGSNEEFDEHYVSKFTLPNLVPHSEASTALPMMTKMLSRTYSQWYNLVDEYSQRTLTYPKKDKLVAISAIANHFARLLPDRYCAGLFESDIPIGLLWNQCYAPTSRHTIRDNWDLSIIFDNTRDADYRAPTWSWASVDERTSFFPTDWAHTGYQYQVSCDILAKSESVTIELEDPNNSFGQVKGAQLKINGPVFRTGPKARDVAAGLPGLVVSLTSATDQELLGLCIMEDVRSERAKIFSVTYGILLSHLHGNVYQRQGYFELEGLTDGTRFPIDDFERKSLTII